MHAFFEGGHAPCAAMLALFPILKGAAYLHADSRARPRIARTGNSGRPRMARIRVYPLCGAQSPPRNAPLWGIHDAVRA